MRRDWTPAFAGEQDLMGDLRLPPTFVMPGVTRHQAAFFTAAKEA
jgi:hypothetical protein